MRLTYPLTLSLFALPAVASPLWGVDDLLEPAQWVLDTADDLVEAFTPSPEDLAAVDEDKDNDYPLADKTQTIWEQLQADESFSTLVKILKFEKDTIKDLNEDHDITFFAVHNGGFPKHHHKEGLWGDAELTLADVNAHLDADPWLLEPSGWDGGGGDDDEKERRRRCLKKIAHIVLQYHILPEGHDYQSLLLNHTFATKLEPYDGAGAGQARRLRIEALPVVSVYAAVNFFSIITASHEAKNGFLHNISHPLLPPQSIFEGAFIASRWLSTTTSAVQRVDGRKFIEWAYDPKHSSPGHPVFDGTPLATLFAPSNRAWNSLPHRLHTFLFSQFGVDILAKLLLFHYVPNVLIHAEKVYYPIHRNRSYEVYASIDDSDVPAFHHEFDVHPGLHGQKLHITLSKSKRRQLPLPIPRPVVADTHIKVNDVDVKISDIPARNGAWHVIDKVLVPPHKGHHEDLQGEGEWAGWDTWLPAWAAEQVETVL